MKSQTLPGIYASYREMMVIMEKFISTSLNKKQFQLHIKVLFIDFATETKRTISFVLGNFNSEENHS